MDLSTPRSVKSRNTKQKIYDAAVSIMKKKGFTLIELLAVIVILAVIALISVPIILNVVEKARKGAFEDSAYGIIDAAKLYYTEASLESSNINETFTFPNDNKL